MSEKETEKTPRPQGAAANEASEPVQAESAEVASEAPLAKQNAELAAKLQEYEELVKRQQAEFDNYRKRTLREKEEYLRYAGSDILKDLLGVIDNFDRAVSLKIDESAAGTSKALFDGVQMIRTQLDNLLKKNQVVEVPGPGTPFNPDIHLAIAQEESPDVQEDTVAEVYQRGFSFQEKVLRVATVRVKKPARTHGRAASEASDQPAPASK